MEKLNVPGCAGVDAPESVPSVSQSAPGWTVAVQLMAEPAVPIRTEPERFPVAVPCCMGNCAPEDESVMPEILDTRNVAGTIACPPEVETSMEVR